MTVGTVTYAQVACDGCGVLFPDLETGAHPPVRGATMARIAASRHGWKFIEYPESKRNVPGPRLWDACPDCELPPTLEAARTVRAKLGQRQRDGTPQRR